MPRSELTDRARALRVDQTRVEEQLWARLRNRKLGGWKWKRQVPRGTYIVDFLCIDASLVVELDGGVHLGSVAYDQRRTAYLESIGLAVLRFPNRDVTEKLDGVCDAIFAACRRRSPLTLPSPPRRAGARDLE
jgi:very-short-patch-repair endonuclease